MAKNKRYTIKEELKQNGIRYDSFRDFYIRLSLNNKLPSKDLFKPEEYKCIVNYLREKGVLDKRGRVRKKEWEIFKKKKTIEEILKGKTKKSPRIEIENTGGMFPCRDNKIIRSTGGISPCRDEY